MEGHLQGCHRPVVLAIDVQADSSFGVLDWLLVVLGLVKVLANIDEVLVVAYSLELNGLSTGFGVVVLSNLIGPNPVALGLEEADLAQSPLTDRKVDQQVQISSRVLSGSCFPVPAEHHTSLERRIGLLLQEEVLGCSQSVFTVDRNILLNIRHVVRLQVSYVGVVFVRWNP